MIYLIDDNKYEQISEKYKIDLNPYNECLIWKRTIYLDDINIILSNADCILIHDSLEENENKERLVAMAKNSNIRYCLFSNGFAATIFENDSIREIKKDRLYNNLIFFINCFKSKGIIDLKLLSFGQNYNVEKALIIQDRLINGTLFRNIDNFQYEVAFPSRSNDYKDLMELVYLSDPTLDFSEFEETCNSKVTDASLMRSVIISLVKNVKRKYDE
jgi:hypothetical protein